MEDFEKLGTFYLGREYDLDQGTTGKLLLYDSRDLVTHGVCVGMTGSGKTGLCIGILEEAALDNIPAIAIDPKGDLGNLLLTFPELRPEDLEPWVSEEEATRKGLSRAEFAKQQADLWRKGLGDWGQDASRIARLKNAADFTIFTPGSTAGIPVSILRSFAAPPLAERSDDEALRDRVNTTATSLLGLVGVSADPIQSREHIVLSRILHEAWTAGRDLDLPAIIEQIQAPPFVKVGVLDLEAFYPSKERFELAARLNGLLAAPAFQTWLQGEPLDIGRLFYTAEGKPRVSIFSVAHLSEPERMFFVSLLLNEILGWVRSQSGTGSLRAIVYMDEIFGFFPPVAEPPSKRPLLTLLKQARAFGVGVLLATQNPVDLDYKGLANAGTWFVGRLQTERDKDRLLEGLEGVAAGAENKFDRQEMEETLAGLGKRIFLMYNVHEDAPVTFQTRWTLSYLAGPLTRVQIKTLMDPRRHLYAGTRAEGQATTTIEESGAGAAAMPSAGAATMPSAGAATVASAGPATAASTITTATVAPQKPAETEPPALPPEIPQYYLPARGSGSAVSGLLYRPGVLAQATVNFVSPESGVGTATKVRRIASAPEGALALDWEAATPLSLPLEELERQPMAGATFAPLPPAMQKLTSFRAWESDYAAWAYRSQTLELLSSPGLKMTSRPGESEGEFRARLQLAAREKRDELSDRLRKKYATRFATLERRELRARQAVEREAEQAKGRKTQTAISIGATILGAFIGRKTLSATTLGRGTTAMRDISRSMEESGDVKRAEENLKKVLEEKADLEAEFQAELDSLEVQMDPVSEDLEKVLLRPRKSDITVDLVALVWMPFRRDAGETLVQAWE